MLLQLLIPGEVGLERVAPEELLYGHAQLMLKLV